LAIDPSSSRTGGSILGDKTRMHELSRRSEAYVRPSPTSGKLGGVAAHTNDVILLCEAAGFDVVLVETVGLGQSEVVVDEAVDMLLLVAPPGGGDELQGIKKGIMEVVDLVVVNKADGPLLGPARHAAADIGRALRLVHPKHHVWQPRVVLVSAKEKTGLQELWTACSEFRAALTQPDARRAGREGAATEDDPPSSLLRSRRARQGAAWMWDALDEIVTRSAHADLAVQQRAKELLSAIASADMTPRRAGYELFQQFLQSRAPRQ
jgi:LAO/AO transport system kinase